MMLYPSIDKLNDIIPSTYSLIILASKRAHEINANAPGHLDSYESDKAVGKALEEVISGDLQMNDQ